MIRALRLAACILALVFACRPALAQTALELMEDMRNRSAAARKAQEAPGAMIHGDSETRMEAGAPPAKAEPFAALIDRMVGDGLDRKKLTAIFARPGVFYDPTFMGKKMRALYRTKYVPKPPAKPGPQLTIWDTWLTPGNREAIAGFMRQNAKPLAAAERQYGVPKQVVVAILMVETRLGKDCGDRPAFSVLASMAATRDFDPIRDFFKEYAVTPEQRVWLTMRQGQKADWAYEELLALLDVAADNRADPTTMPGSIYGAVGYCQFMPTNIVRLGVDGDRDGRVDLFSPADAIHSIANFLKNSGWTGKLSHKAKIKVVMRYNHDTVYAGTVLAIAKRI